MTNSSKVLFTCAWANHLTMKKFNQLQPNHSGHEKIYWLILSLSFHRLKNMDNSYKKFIFVTIKRINMQISTSCHFCDRKREFNVILIHGMWMICFITGDFQIPKAGHAITWNHVLYIKMTSNSVCWWQIRQNVEICTLIRSIITNINALWKLSMFFNILTQNSRVETIFCSQCFEWWFKAFDW